jgi:hypothetical protein
LGKIWKLFIITYIDKFVIQFALIYYNIVIPVKN